jgi:tryptophan synthase alpha chain
MAFSLKASTAGSASFAAAGPRRAAAAAPGRVSFRGAAPVVAVRAAAAAAAAGAVAADKRSISGTFADLKKQGKVSAQRPNRFSLSLSFSLIDKNKK